MDEKRDPFELARSLYLAADGMGGVTFTGIMPRDVAKLTTWQIVNDFVLPRAEMIRRMKGEPEFVEPTLPTLQQHIEGQRDMGSTATDEELTAQYEALAAAWNAPEEDE